MNESMGTHEAAFWARWWLGFVITVITYSVGMAILSQSFVLIGIVAGLAAAAGWTVVVERYWRANSTEMPSRFSFIWGRVSAAGAVLILVFALVTNTIFLVGLDVVGRIVAIPTGFLLAAWFVLLFIGGLVVIALWIARVAESKGRSFTAWFWLGLLFPIISWIIVATMGPLRPQPAVEMIPVGPARDTKQCAYCGEEILAVAVKCKHCGEFLESYGEPIPNE